jgi:CRP/FNR family transcriptional regulator, cyclic AMP receptor protein
MAKTLLAPSRQSAQRITQPNLGISAQWGFAAQCSTVAFSGSDSIMMNSYQPGELIFVQGQASECVYLIESGEVELLESSETRTLRIAKLIKGDLLGEMALVDERPRAFSARAVTETTVSIVSREQFVKLMFRDPAEGLRYLGAFFERLRVMNKPPGTATPVETDKPRAAHIRVLPLTNAAKKAVPDEGIIVTRFPFRVGREPAEGRSRLSSNDLGLPDTEPYSVSREHFSIETDGEGVMLYDRGSFHGTIVNGNQIGGNRTIGSIRLQPGGNEIIAGLADSPFRFSVQVSER